MFRLSVLVCGFSIGVCGFSVGVCGFSVGVTCLRLLGSNEEEPGNNLGEEDVCVSVECFGIGDECRPAQISRAKMPVVARRKRRKHLIRHDVHGQSHLAFELRQGSDFQPKPKPNENQTKTKPKPNRYLLHAVVHALHARVAHVYADVRGSRF